MKKIIAAAMLVCLPVAAQATGKPPSSNTQIVNQNNPTASARQAQGQAQRQAQSQRQIARGGSARATGGAATASVGPVTVNNSDGGGSGGVVIQDRLQAPGVAIGAPPGGVCAVGISLGGSVVGGSGAFGISWEGEQCERRMKAHAAMLRGDVELAREIMCEDREERAARLRLAQSGRGQPCLADMPPAAPSPSAAPPSAATVAAASSPIPAAPHRNRPAYCAAAEARGTPLLNSECRG
jgi:hypothetical protein